MLPSERSPVSSQLKNAIRPKKAAELFFSFSWICIRYYLPKYASDMKLRVIAFPIHQPYWYITSNLHNWIIALIISCVNSVVVNVECSLHHFLRFLVLSDRLSSSPSYRYFIAHHHLGASIGGNLCPWIYYYYIIITFIWYARLPFVSIAVSLWYPKYSIINVDQALNQVRLERQR